MFGWSGGGRFGSIKGRWTGPVIGKMQVDVNGDWDGWYERNLKLRPNAHRADLFFEAINLQNRSGLVNIDSVRFYL